MNSSNELIIKARSIGKYAANLAHGEATSNIAAGAHHPGDDTGSVVLEAYRAFGLSSVIEIIEAYQGGYNSQAAELGDPVVRRAQIKNGIGWALPSATKEEIRAIKDEL